MFFLYDNTYPGFLTAVYEIYHFGTSHLSGIEPQGGEAHLFGGEDLVVTSFIHADQVISAFERDCGKKAVRCVYRAFLSDDPGREMKIFEFMRRGFHLKKNLFHHEKEPWFQDILAMVQEVGNEAEKFRGILRFSELEEGAFLAKINPTHNILPVIAPHFAARLPAEDWAIYDVKRRTAAVYHHGKISLVEVPLLKTDLKYSSEEEKLRALWQDYYRHMGIEDRRNPDVRRNFLPKKYWPYLTEMGDVVNGEDIPLKHGKPGGD